MIMVAGQKGHKIREILGRDAEAYFAELFSVFCGGVVMPGDIKGNAKLDEAREMGRQA